MWRIVPCLFSFFFLSGVPLLSFFGFFFYDRAPMPCRFNIVIVFLFIFHIFMRLLTLILRVWCVCVCARVDVPQRDRADR